MTFGTSLKTILERAGYSLVSEFITPQGRLAVRLQTNDTKAFVRMFRSDAAELARGTTTAAAIATRNRHVKFDAE